MEYRRLGKAGVKVSPICLGTAFRANLEEEVCVRVIERAIDLGCNFLDCANNYGRGRSEEILGRAIKGKRDDLVITSKVWTPTAKGPNDRGLSRFHILREVENSLRRLQTDRVDIYYLHSVDPETEWEETLRTMEDLVRQGKVRYVGASNYSAWQLTELLWTADVNGWEKVVVLQNQYNLLNRKEIEPDILSVCRRHGVGLVTFSPLAVGLLTGLFRRGQEPPEGSPWSQQRLDQVLSEKGDRLVQTLIDVADGRGCTPGQVAIAWLLDHPELTAPIIGPDLPEHVDEAFGGLEFQLTEEERETLDQASRWEGPGGYL